MQGLKPTFTESILLTKEDMEFLVSRVSTSTYQRRTPEMILRHIIKTYKNRVTSAKVVVPANIFTRICDRCGAEFKTRSFKQKYCTTRFTNPTGCGAIAFKGQAELRRKRHKEFIAKYPLRGKVYQQNRRIRDLMAPTRTTRELSRQEQEKRRQQALDQYYANKGKWRRNYHLRLERERIAGVFSEPVWRDILSVYEHRCVMCGVKDDAMTVDHLIPLSLGGTNFRDNLAPMCHSCNRTKSTRIWFPYRPVDKSWPKDKTPMFWPVVQFVVQSHTDSRGN